MVGRVCVSCSSLGCQIDEPAGKKNFSLSVRHVDPEGNFLEVRDGPLPGRRR